MSVKTHKGPGVTLTFDYLSAVDESSGAECPAKIHAVVFLREPDGTVTRVDDVLEGKLVGAVSRRMMFRDGHTLRNAPWPPRLEAQSDKKAKRKWWHLGDGKPRVTGGHFGPQSDGPRKPPTTGSSIRPAREYEYVSLLVEAGEQFRFYEKQHLAKNTPESLAKAEVNRKLAERIEGALHGQRVSPPQDVVRLVHAARVVAFNIGAAASPAMAELDKASEAFASRVPWEDEPEQR